MAGKSSFLDKVLGRLGRLDAEGVQKLSFSRLARERGFLETLFNAIEDGLLVVTRRDAFSTSTRRLPGCSDATGSGRPTDYEFIPGLQWTQIARLTRAVVKGLFRHDSKCIIRASGFCGLYAAPLDGQGVGSAGVA